jgi:hypothetical protein
VSGMRGRDERSIIDRLVPDVFTGDDRSPTVSTFLRGVTTGALVGAAIAGSALWTRYRRQRGEARSEEVAAEAAEGITGDDRPG